MPTTDTEFATLLAATLAAFKAGTITEAQLATQISAELGNWAGTPYTKASIAKQIANIIASYSANTAQVTDWWAGSVTGGPNNNGTYPFTNSLGVTSFLPSPAKLASVMQKGDPGTDGGVLFNFSTTTSDGDPGQGNVRANNSAFSSATFLYVDNAERGGIAISSWLDTFGSSNRGVITIREAGSPRFVVFQVTGAVADGTGYRKIPVLYLAGSASFTDGAVLVVGFSQAGAAGPAGPSGPAGSNAWTPVIAIVSDGSRRVLQVVDWTGGQGTKPSAGLYVGSTGLVSTIASAVDVRGAAGSAGSGAGDLLASNNLSDVANAATARNNLGIPANFAAKNEAVGLAIVFGG